MSFNPKYCNTCGVCDDSKIGFDPLNNIDNDPIFCNSSCNSDKNTIINNSKYLEKFAKYIFEILDNQDFLGKILGTRNMARSYFNQRKFFCRTFNINMNEYNKDCSQKNKIHKGKVTVWLSGGQSDNCFINSQQYIPNNENAINLMRLLPENSLPSSFAGSNGLFWTKTVNNIPNIYPITNPSLPPCRPCPVSPFGNCGNELNDKQKVIYYYFKHIDFFTKLLASLKRSVEDHSNFRFLCIKFIFPEDIYCGSLDERTLYATGTFLRQVYSVFLRGRKISNNHLLRYPNILSNNELKCK